MKNGISCSPLSRRRLHPAVECNHPRFAQDREMLDGLVVDPMEA